MATRATWKPHEKHGELTKRSDLPNSVYLAYPGENVQVEVYDPRPQRARRLAREGRVRPIS